MSKTEAALLAELPEAQAGGELARIYAEIRRLSAVPMVALIYRHLATIPGALEWAWGLLEPAMRAGQVQQQAWRLAQAAAVPGVPAVARPALRLMGIGAADEAAIAAVLDAYNRANPVNIVALRCLAHHLAGGVERPSQAPSWEPWQPPSPPPALPPMVDPQSMGPTVRELVLLLTDRGDTGAPSPLWPSLYRHLARWPAFLGMAGIIVPPAFDAIDAVARRLRAEVDEAARTLARRMAPPAGLEPPAQRDRLQAAIDAFTSRIPEMVVIGGLLRRALPPQRKEAALAGS